MKIVYLTEMEFVAERIEEYVPNQSVLFTQMSGLNAAHLPIEVFLNNKEVLRKFDVCIFIYPKSRPEVLSICKDIKDRCKLVLNQEGPRDFWYDWKPEHQKLFIEAMDMCDMFFANNESDLEFFRGFMGDKAVLSPVSFSKKQIEKFSTDIRNNTILIGGNMCKWYGGLSSIKVIENAGLQAYIPSMGRKQQNEEILYGKNIKILPYMDFDNWTYFVSTNKYVVHLMKEIGGGNLSLTASALGIPCIGNKLWDTQRICQPRLSIDVWEIQKGRDLMYRLMNDKNFYDECALEAKDLAYQYFEKEVVANIQLNNLKGLF